MNASIKRKNGQRQLQLQKLEKELREDSNFDEVNIEKIVKEVPLTLVKQLREGQVSAVEVLKAFQFTALELTKKINCITEFIPEAQKWAENCDNIPEADRKLLHGLPISIKENINVQGMDSTLGMAKYLYQPATEHAILVQILIKNGAVPFCKTNVPQSLLSFCCCNPVYGTTVNPHNHTRTPGGSSGGECALIAGGGSIVGIGSDLAGSARIPASMSGCFGLKVTSTRISSTGFKKGLPGMVGVSSCPGIMGRDSEIIKLVLQALIETPELNLKEHTIVPIPWNSTVLEDKRKLTFGYLDNMEFYPCTPGVKRAVQEAKTALENSGHKVVPFEFFKPDILFQTAYALLTADGVETLKKNMIGEIIDSSLQSSLRVTFAKGILRKIFRFLTTYNSPIMASAFEGQFDHIADLWKTLNVRKEMIQEIKDRMEENHIDLLLMPVYALPAPQQYVPAIVGAAYIYTVIANFGDFASGAVPVTTESEEDQKLLKDYPAENDRVLRIVKEATKGAVGMPIGVSITGLTLQEELVLKGMTELDKALQVLD